MRFGLVGTGDWARQLHLAGLHRAADVEPVAVWGRDREKTERLAAAGGLRAYDDFDRMLAEVDAVAFAVPPVVQSELGCRAAAAGKHLLLEKPIAVDAGAARELERVVRRAAVATAVFVTACYTPERRSWERELQEVGPLRGGSGLFLASAISVPGPFNTPWRREKGALWDIGPHVLAAVEGALGPVESVAAAASGVGDLVHVVFAHAAGATSAVTMSIGADARASRSDLLVWGDEGTWALPRMTTDPVDAYVTAVQELRDCATRGVAHPLDVTYGRRVVELLAAAEALSTSGRTASTRDRPDA